MSLQTGTARVSRAAETAAAPAAGRGVGEAGHYRPHLDGLRAVAVYLVVLFHAGSDRFVGGFVGVDVFFVLSGFLVTQLLVRDLAGAGSVSFRRFYSRRFRRLLPAAFVMLVVTALVYSALASPVEVAQAEGGFKASFLYYANWYFIDQSTDYFGADLASNPVLHFWSLAVEEQFYLIWPVLLGGLYVLSRRAGPRQWQVLRLAVLVGAVTSLVWAWSLKSSDPSRAYYGTDARAYQLLAGAAVALTPGLVPRLRRFSRGARIASVGALVALVVVASSWTDLDAIERGLAATCVTVALIVALETAPGGAGRRALSVAPVVYLGRISYGTYLWHWPVIVVMSLVLDLSVLTTIALTVLIATALASLSYQLLEHPIRVSGLLDRHRTPVIAVGLAVSVISALVIIPTITDRSSTTSLAATTDPTTTGLTPVPDDLDFEAIRTAYPEIRNCYEEPVEECTVVEGSGDHILLIGDSHAAMMIPAFEAIAREEDLTLSVAVKGGCPWQEDLYIVPIEVFGDPLTPEACENVRDDTYERVIQALDPDIVVGMNLGYETRGLKVPYRDRDQTPMRNGTPRYEALLERTTTESLDRLTGDERKVLLVEPIPVDAALTDAIACLSDATVVEACRYVVDAAPTSLERLYRRLDEERDDVWAVDLDRLVCPYLPICDPIVDGMVTKMDGSHLHRQFARSLAPALRTYLVDNRVLAE